MTAGSPGPYVWVDDDAVTECTRCNTTFGFFNRRHHCRRCGKVFCDGCSKNKIILPEEDGYGNEKVRVCQPCFDISTGKRQAVPGVTADGPTPQQDRAALFSNQSVDSGFSSNWLGSTDGHGKQMATMDKEIAKLQKNALQNAARSIEQNADTLEMIVNQSERTKEDLRRIENIHATLSATDQLIQKMERGMFNLGGKTAKFKPPPPKASDIDYEIQVSGSFRWTKRVLRLTDDFFLRLSKNCDAFQSPAEALGGQVMDTVNYSQLDAILVHKKAGRFTIRFSKSCHSKPWELWAEDPQLLVLKIVERAAHRGFKVQVGFEQGAKEFNCELMGQIAAEVCSGEAYTTVSQLASAVGHAGPVAGSEFHSAIQESLLQLAEISALQDEALDRHMKDLDEMEEQVPVLQDAVTQQSSRVRNIR